MTRTTYPLRMIVTALFTVCMLPTASASVTLYLATGSNGVNGELYTINSANGSIVTAIGPLIDALGNHYGLTGLRFNNLSGLLYGSTANKSPTNPGFLVTIDPLTAHVTPIGSFNQGSFVTMSDLAFDISSGNMYGVSGNSQNFYLINQLTGAATIVGDTGIGVQSGGGLAGNSAGTIYGTDAQDLFTYDKRTGSATHVGPLNTSRNVNSLAFDPTDALYGIDVRECHLYKINASNGNATDLGFTVANADALAFEPAAGVPEPCTLVLGLFAVGFSAIGYRKRVKQPLGLSRCLCTKNRCRSGL